MPVCRHSVQYDDKSQQPFPWRPDRLGDASSNRDDEAEADDVIVAVDDGC